MAKIGNIYIGGKDAETPNSENLPSGIAFPLKRESEIDCMWESQDSQWQVELKQDHFYAVARSHEPLIYDTLVTSGLEQVQRCLDIIAVKRLGILILDHPENEHIAVFQVNGAAILKYFSVGTRGFKVNISIKFRDKDGNIEPSAPIPEPVWTWAFRYYRLSQASQDIFEAYRNLFLSLEALLNNICPLLPNEQEGTWLRRALKQVSTNVPLAKHAPATEADPINYFMETQYKNVRCRLFHAKYPDIILPLEELNPIGVSDSYEDLLRLWRDIVKEYFQIPAGGSVITRQSFKLYMNGLFKKPLSLYFTEDNSPDSKDDTQVSPLGLTAYEFEQSRYLGETKPGIISWQGDINLLDIHKNLSIHRICSLLDKNLLSVAYIKDGLFPLGVDVFQTYQSMKFLNIGQPKTTF